MLSTLLILQAINAERLIYHEPPLKASYVLQVAAQAKVRDETVHHYFSHYSPQGKDVWDFVWQAEANLDRVSHTTKFSQADNFTVLGENLSKGYDDVPSLVQAWMNSPTHRENILDPKWKVTGFGIVKDEKTVLVSEEFAD